MDADPLVDKQSIGEREWGQIMIKDDKQYKITKDWIERFKESVEKAKADSPPADVHPVIHQAMIDALESEIFILQSEIEEYDGRCSMTASDV